MAKSPSWGMIVSFLVNTFSALMKQEGPFLWLPNSPRVTALQLTKPVFYDTVV